MRADMSFPASYADYKRIFAEQALPLAWVDLDLLDENIAAVKRRAGGMPVRIASKSIRSRAILRRILDADPCFRGLMCFAVPEAVWLAEQGFDDLLLGYPAWQHEAIRAVCAQLRAGRTITLMVDSVAHVEHLARIAFEENVVLPLCLDVDMSVDFGPLHFGVWRSGTRDAQAALQVFDTIRKHPQLRLDGVMGYEAQIAGVGDAGSGFTGTLRAALIAWLKRRSIPQIARRRAAVVAALKAAGASLRFVNGGGTGSFESTRQESCVTELTAGSAFFSPGLFDHYRQFRHQPAAGFAVEIVRQPKPGLYTCAGGGYVASGAAGPEKLPVVHLPQGAQLTALEGAGEVQTPVHYTGPETLQLGDPIFLRHAKAGELCERFEHLLLVQGGRITGETPTYRGEGQTFL